MRSTHEDTQAQSTCCNFQHSTCTLVHLPRWFLQKTAFTRHETAPAFSNPGSTWWLGVSAGAAGRIKQHTYNTCTVWNLQTAPSSRLSPMSRGLCTSNWTTHPTTPDDVRLNSRLQCVHLCICIYAYARMCSTIHQVISVYITLIESPG